MRVAFISCMLPLVLGVTGCATSIGRDVQHAAGNAPGTAHAVAATPLSARAVSRDPADPRVGSAPSREFVSDDNIGDLLRESRRVRTGIADLGVRRLASRLEDRLYQRTRIRFSASYTMLYQHAYAGSGPKDAVGSDFDLAAAWHAVGRKGRDEGGLEAKLEGRYEVGTPIPPSALSTTIDSLWPTVSGFGIQPFSLIQVYWHQSLLGGRLRLLFGKLSASSTFFGNRINSSSLYFTNYALSDSPAVFFPGNGLGVHAIYRATDRWTFRVGMQDANGVKTELDPATLEAGEFWYAAQVDFTPHVRGLGPGTYRLGGWHVDGRERAGTGPGQGFALSIDQQLAEQWIAFLRYERQGAGLVTGEVRFASLTGTRRALRFGVGVEGPISALPHDYLGVGGAWGDPADSRAGDSIVGEVFYRAQMTDSSQLTLGLQVIESSTIYDQVAVFSARYRFEF